MIDKLYLLFEVLAILVGLFALHEKKKKPSVATIIYIVIEMVVVVSINENWLPQGMELMLYIGLIILCIYEFGDKVYDACLYTVLDIVMIGILQLLCALVVCLAMQTFYVDVLGNLIINIATFLLLVLIFRFGNMHKLIQPVLNNGVIGKILLIIAALVCLVVFWFFKQHDKLYWKTAVEMTVFVIALALIVFQWQKEKWMNKQREAELNSYEKYNVIYKDLIQEVRRRQHDFNNHLQAIFSMNALADNLEELVQQQNEYCAGIIAENTTNKLLREDIPSVLAGFFYTKIGQAEKQGITVKYRIVVDRIEQYVRFTDLVEIIGNLFDNSMEAVLHEKERKMECYVMQDEEELMIEVSNPCEWKTTVGMPAMIKDGKSTKGENRGLGLGNVRRTLEKYGGTLEIKSTDEYDVNYVIFRARIKLSQK